VLEPIVALKRPSLDLHLGPGPQSDIRVAHLPNATDRRRPLAGRGAADDVLLLRENVRAEPNLRPARSTFSSAVGERQLMRTLREQQRRRRCRRTGRCAGCTWLGGSRMCRRATAEHVEAGGSPHRGLRVGTGVGDSAVAVGACRRGCAGLRGAAGGRRTLAALRALGDAAWLPYDERQLFRMLGISREQARRWIADDQRHNFAQLARRRGLAPRIVAKRLVRSWAREFGALPRAELQERALRTLTQGHLSQHVLFHVFHHPQVGARARRLFTTSPMHYLDLRRAGYTPAEIGALSGRSRRATARGIRRTWRSSGIRGARRAETPIAQARRFAGHQFAVLEKYLDSSLHRKRPEPPPPPPRIATPRPHLHLLCTMFASRTRASQPQN
jgi:hypothetical protein